MQSEPDKLADGDEFDPEQWMSLSEALEAMQSKYGRRVAKENLLELIADEEISLRCPQPTQTMDFGRSKRLGLSRTQLHEGPSGSSGDLTGKHPAQMLLISKSFFSRADGWRIDPERVDWQLGTITATRPARMQIEQMDGEGQHLDLLVAKRVMVERDQAHFPLKVQVSADDQATEKLPATKPSAKKGGKRGNTGKRLTRYNYGPLRTELKRQIETGEIYKFGDPFVLSTQARLEEYIMDYLEKQDPEVSESTVRTEAKRTMEAWRAHVARERTTS